MDDKELLENLIAKLSTSIEKLESDPRCSDENNIFENTVQKLKKDRAVLRDRLTEMQTEYFKAEGKSFSNELKEADKEADNLNGLLDKASNTVEIVGAVEKIGKVLRLFL